MPTFLQAVGIPTRCFLKEVLLWVAFQRLPVAMSDPEGIELRESPEIDGYAVADEDIGLSFLSDDECRRAGIPPDPHSRAIADGIEEPAYFDELLKNPNMKAPARAYLEGERRIAIEHKAACDAWKLGYDQIIEFPASQVFVALKGGSLRARGRLLHACDLNEAQARLQEQDERIVDIEPTDIPASFWTLKGIDFEASAAWDGKRHYCHVTCRTQDVLTFFPGERRLISNVEQVGESFVLSDRTDPPTKVNSLRGRPPYPWEEFHLEVAAMLLAGNLPQKKEAAIQHFQQWFQQTKGVRPSRAAIGGKLTRYYDRFVRGAGQKTRRREHPLRVHSRWPCQAIW